MQWNFGRLYATPANWLCQHITLKYHQLTYLTDSVCFGSAWRCSYQIRISFEIPCQQAFCDGTLSFSLAPHLSHIARYMCINIFMKISYIVWLIWRILSMPKQLCSLLHIIFPLGAKFYLSLMTRAPIALNWSELINYARDSYTMSLCSSKLWQNTQHFCYFRRCLSAPDSRLCASVTTSVS